MITGTKNHSIFTFRSPEILAPARIPVAAGKNMANTEKKDSPFLKSGPRLVTKTSAKKINVKKKEMINFMNLR